MGMIPGILIASISLVVLRLPSLALGTIVITYPNSKSVWQQGTFHDVVWFVAPTNHDFANTE